MAKIFNKNGKVISEIKNNIPYASVQQLNKNDMILNEIKGNVSYSSVQKLVQAIKSKLCRVNKGGAYEVWFSVTGSAGIVVSASAEGGIKAIIKCN